MSSNYGFTNQVQNLPSPKTIDLPVVREEYTRFLQQLEIVADGAVVLSDPYFFKVETQGILDSVQDWYRDLVPQEVTKLLLLSLLSRPFDPSKVSLQDGSRFIDDLCFVVPFGTATISLAEGTSSIPFGLDVLPQRRMALDDPGLKQLMDSLAVRSPLETLTSEFIGGQPGNYAYQAWQVADWSPDWAVVYGVCDAAIDGGYPFPWLLGFIRRNRLEQNFIELLHCAGDRFDWGFYYTFGTVSGRWRLAKLALTVPYGCDSPPREIIDDLLMLNEGVRDSILEDSQDEEHFLSRVQDIKDGAYDAGFKDDVTLLELLRKAGDKGTLASIEEQLPAWEHVNDLKVECEQEEREQILRPFKATIDAWVAVVAGPQPRGINVQMSWSARRSLVGDFLETYVLSHFELPIGRHDLSNNNVYTQSVRIIDFEEVAFQVAAPSANHSSVWMQHKD